MRFSPTIITTIALVFVAIFAIQGLLPEPVAKAPELTLKLLDGRTLRLKQLQGKPLLVTFWSTTCPQCVKEIPHLVELYEDLNPRGLEIIGIAMAYDPPNFVVQMVQERRIPYPIALDLDASAAKAFGEVEFTPTSFLISPDGRIAQRTLGKMDRDWLRDTIRQML